MAVARARTGVAAAVRHATGSRRLAFRKHRSLYLGGAVVLVAVLVALAAPVLAPMDPLQQQLRARLKPPIWDARGVAPHVLGTDEFGRDVLSRIVHGARISLTVGVLVVVVAAPFGILVGTLAGFYGGKLEAFLMRAADAQHALPGILLAIIVVTVLGQNMTNLILVLAISTWVIYARIVFTSVRSLRDRDFVQAAAALGASDGRLMALHILPGALSPVIVVSALQVARVMLLEAALSFLGLGVPPPEPSWGGMLADGRNRLLVAPWIATYPGLALALTVWGINMLGDGLRQLLDPRLRNI
jgi:peptide/nickel transport system permease protein